MTENELSYIIRGCIFKVYKNLGPGLLEAVYCAALCIELEKAKVNYRANVPVPVHYDGQVLELGFKMDILVEEKVLIEVKAIDQLGAVHHKHVITYLKLTGLKLGILVNFNSDHIENSIFRKVNGL